MLPPPTLECQSAAMEIAGTKTGVWAGMNLHAAFHGAREFISARGAAKHWQPCDNSVTTFSLKKPTLPPAWERRALITLAALIDPLGLTIARDHHLIAANGDDGNLVEINPWSGKQVAVKLVDNTGGPPAGTGALFGLIAVREGVYFVDDASNTFNFIDDRCEVVILAGWLKGTYSQCVGGLGGVENAAIPLRN
jgi:hypothetical protein